MARALVHKPKYILGDEISSALDTHTAAFIYQKMQQYVKENKAIGLLVSHDPTIKDYTDKHFQISDGCLEEIR